VTVLHSVGVGVSGTSNNIHRFVMSVRQRAVSRIV